MRRDKRCADRGSWEDGERLVQHVRDHYKTNIVDLCGKTQELFKTEERVSFAQCLRRVTAAHIIRTWIVVRGGGSSVCTCVVNQWTISGAKSLSPPSRAWLTAARTAATGQDSRAARRSSAERGQNA